ncbi:hypothetical protein VP1G_08044 [Cytospora mali]|uniref:Uncharacterized protein n=1 Tax=Cytospora mali TaxID=578113 RepID=A0A194VAD8_CYTMA|nr:hypothetical protein VP1G_08044 [Valsa mali var. pyri (nom. inval.)]
MSYYGDAQWPASAGSQPGWDHQTPPTRSGLPPNNSRDSATIDTLRPGASSTIPREEATAFWYQFEEVERAIENLVKSGKMFGAPGGRHPRGPGGPQRPHSIEFEGRPGPGPGPGPGHPSSNLQNFYASQRHQSSRGSNEAEQMMQAKRRMAAQRERELRNYHQEQQYNRTSIADIQFGAATVTPKPERALSPSGMSEEARRELIARQRSALYGEGPFAQAGGYVDETGTPRPGVPIHHGGPSSLRGPSPLTYESGPPPPNEPMSAGPRDRASSNASPASNPPGNRGPLEQTSRTTNSSPGGENGKAVAGKTVAPIGTRPSAPSNSQGPSNPSLQRQSTTPLPSPLNQSYHAPGSGEATTSSGPSNPTSAGSEAPVGLGSWPQRGQPWGPKAQTSVWG